LQQQKSGSLIFREAGLLILACNFFPDCYKMKLQRLINEFYNGVGKFYLPRCRASLFFCSKIPNSQNTRFNTAWLFFLTFSDTPRKILICGISITLLLAQLARTIKTVDKVKGLRIYVVSFIFFFISSLRAFSNLASSL
jgi:hypothetical protein